jgi:thioredoxin reductase (NADPH)
MHKKIYDCLVIGAGPAGLSAAIYMARYNRSVLVLDKGDGRWNTHEHNENYLGFPDGISTQTLRRNGISQAKKFGGEIKEHCTVTEVTKTGENFLLEYTQKDKQKKTCTAKSLIFATGVTDIQPQIPNWQEFWGKSLFWCITCDGYKTRNKKVTIIGNSNDATTTALQFLNFTTDITYITNCINGTCSIDSTNIAVLKNHNISFHEGCIKEIKGNRGLIKEIIMEDGTHINTEYIINQQGNFSNSQVAVALGVKTDPSGGILVDTHQKTNIPFVYAAGDVTKIFSHQVATAVHEGATAAESANYDLYEDFQKI